MLMGSIAQIINNVSELNKSIKLTKVCDANSNSTSNFTRCNYSPSCAITALVVQLQP